ncbi:MAG TPA: lysylphosphatidylglycerol synthase transmembrane domain-containing protein [Solirubrobacteraceae bacterium]|nr:lysylphosphatidylglycerol synthase transmembrane domain-containing protein [Solirubrobacteraceae bacterium]
MSVVPPEELGRMADPLPSEFAPSSLRRHALVVAGILAAVAAVVVLVPGLGEVRDSLSGARPGWLVAAAILQLGSCLSYVIAFRAVFCRHMSWRTSYEIGTSELAANSLLSVGGAGGLALGAWILRRGGNPPGQIARRTVAFFLLTSLANVTALILAGAGLASGVLSGSPSPALALVPAVVGVAIVALALVLRVAAGSLARRLHRPRLSRALAALSEGVDEALSLLRGRDGALLVGACGYMLFDVAMLGACFAAFGHDVPPVGVLLLAYLIGQLGNLVPVPGGIGGVDAGLIGTLVVYGVDPVPAAVAVLAYRAFLLWVPAALGLPALASLRRRLRHEAHDIAACAPGQEVEVLGAGTVRTEVPTIRIPARNVTRPGGGT